MKFRVLLILVIFSLLTGCASYKTRARVKEVWRQPLHRAINYTVQPGDTLYSIAWGYGLDYRQVAAQNNITANYQINAGQKLLLKPGNGITKFIAAQTTTAKNTVTASGVNTQPLKFKTKQQTVAKSTSVQPTATEETITPSVEQEPTSSPIRPTTTPQPETATAPQFMQVSTVNKSGIAWAWPAHGKVIAHFSPDGFNKGLDIIGKAGSPVLAAASGKVVYAGNGLRGYGNLVIIKNNDEFLSAYAHNQKLLVQEGQVVKVGQLIAKMGDTEAKRVVLHFEIRQAGKPVDPLNYLPR